MKLLVLFSLVALALADDISYRPYGSGYDDDWYKPQYGSGQPYRPYGKGYDDDQYRPQYGSGRPYRPYGKGYDDRDYKPYDYYSPFYYHYNIKYPYWKARQGKWERSDGYRTRGSYYVDEPYSDIYVQYDFPQKQGFKRGGYRW